MKFLRRILNWDRTDRITCFSHELVIEWLQCMYGVAYSVQTAHAHAHDIDHWFDRSRFDNYAQKFNAMDPLTLRLYWRFRWNELMHYILISPLTSTLTLLFIHCDGKPRHLNIEIKTSAFSPRTNVEKVTCVGRPEWYPNMININNNNNNWLIKQ